MPPVVVVPGGVECWCGRRGCLERYLNEAALRELAGLEAGERARRQPIAGIGITYNVGALEAIGGQPATSFDGLLALCAQAVEHDTRLFSAGQKDAWVGQIIPWAIAVPKLYADDPDLNDRLMNGETGRSGGAQRAFRPCSTRRTRSAACSGRSRSTPRA